VGFGDWWWTGDKGGDVRGWGSDYLGLASASTCRHCIMNLKRMGVSWYDVCVGVGGGHAMGGGHLLRILWELFFQLLLFRVLLQFPEQGSGVVLVFPVFI
jgi:1,4-dihydroxy-2-naphthoyl-CoA synthase